MYYITTTYQSQNNYITNMLIYTLCRLMHLSLCVCIYFSSAVCHGYYNYFFQGRGLGFLQRLCGALVVRTCFENRQMSCSPHLWLPACHTASAGRSRWTVPLLQVEEEPDEIPVVPRSLLFSGVRPFVVGNHFLFQPVNYANSLRQSMSLKELVLP